MTKKCKTMKKCKVVITDRLAPPADIEQSVLGKAAKIIILQEKNEQNILTQIEDADALLVWHEITLTKLSLSRMKKCKVIVRIGAGFDNVDIEFAAKKNIIVCNVPDYGTNDVADHTIALILNIYRNMENVLEKSRMGKLGWRWEVVKSKRLTDQSLGIVGLGRIGTAVAMRAKSFGLKVLFYDPFVARGVEKSLGLERKDSIGELAEQSDIISFHTPLTEETRNMASKNLFSIMKKGSVIINTARGGIVNLDDLYAAMQSNIIWAVGFDVLPQEPPNEKNKLIKSWIQKDDWVKDRMLITPHCAFYSPEAYIEMRKKAALEAQRVLEGKEPLNCINKEYF
jgi:phosphoglycerate dehydrogenase-like enzyme